MDAYIKNGNMLIHLSITETTRLLREFNINREARTCRGGDGMDRLWTLVAENLLSVYEAEHNKIYFDAWVSRDDHVLLPQVCLIPNKDGTSIVSMDDGWVPQVWSRTVGYLSKVVFV